MATTSALRPAKHRREVKRKLAILSDYLKGDIAFLPAIAVKEETALNEIPRTPRILESVTKPVPIETKGRRKVRLPANSNAPTTLDRATVAALSALMPRASYDGEHSRVINLIAEGDIKQAARIAARLINSGNDGGFFAYGGSLQFEAAKAEYDRFVLRQDSEGATVVSITPEFAQILLLNNEGNRRVNAQNLEDIMRDMIGGNWAMNGESLVLSREGRLNDGQHRSYASLLTGLTFRTALSFGVDRATIGTMNIGRKRTGSDRLGIAGITNSISMAALSTLVFEMINKRKPTAAETDAFYQDNEQELIAANTSCGDNMKGVGRAAAGAAALYLIQHGYAADEVKQFFASIRSGEMMAKRDPRMVLHKAIFDSRMKIKLSRENWVAAFVEHFVALKNGKMLSAPSFQMKLDWA